MPDLEFLKGATLFLAAVVEGAAALVIGIAAVQATVRVLLLFLPGRPLPDGSDPQEALRLRLGGGSRWRWRSR